MTLQYDVTLCLLRTIKTASVQYTKFKHFVSLNSYWCRIRAGRLGQRHSSTHQRGESSDLTPLVTLPLYLLDRRLSGLQTLSENGRDQRKSFPSRKSNFDRPVHTSHFSESAKLLLYD